MPQNMAPFVLFNAVTLAAERTSGVISLRDAVGFSLATAYTRSAATGFYYEVDFYPERADADNQTAAKKFKLYGGEVALDGTNAVETLEPYQGKRTSSSSENGVFFIAALMPYARVRLNDVASGGANDLVTTWCTVIRE